MTVARSRRIEFADDAAIVHAADYHNQFYMSGAGKMATALVALGRPVNGNDILTVKLQTKWGQEDPDDVKRRYNNIARLMGGNTI